MKRLPGVLAPSVRSAAERRLFKFLDDVDLGPGACALHSLNLPQHATKVVGEADFVIVAPAGVLVLEVKGGRVSRDEDGLWHYVDRFDVDHTSSEGPFRQAEAAMWSIRESLTSRLGRSAFAELGFGFGVVFPDLTYTDDSVDAPAELVIDMRSTGDAVSLQRRLTALLSHWQKRTGAGAAQPATVKAAREALRGSFDLVPSLAVRATDVRERMESLTAEQYRSLDWVQNTPRLLVSGGAGTGKTMLAMEIARRDAAVGRTVLLTCHSRVLARFLRTQPLPAEVTVSSLDDAADLGPFETVVVDEAQDLFHDDGLDAIDRLVDGGLADGRWRCLFDLNNQAGFCGPVSPDALELLRTAAGDPILLTRNCRNSKPVVVQTRAITGADLGTPTAGEGPQVILRYASDDQDEARLLGNELERLSAQDVSGAAITIVSPRPMNESPLRFLPAATLANTDVVAADDAPTWPPRRLTFALIEDFKGLENDFVLVCGLERLADTAVDLARLYVAMSRPRVGLFLLVPSRLRASLRRLQESNLDLMTAGAGGDA